MRRETEYVKVKFALGSITLVVGLLAANLALFHWVERTGLYYMLGYYARYVCAYGGFAAMIFGAMLINDAWALSNVMKGKYGLPTNYTTTKAGGTYGEVKLPSEVYDEFQVPSSLPEYKKRIIRNILKLSGLKEKRRRKPTRRKNFINKMKEREKD